MHKSVVLQTARIGTGASLCTLRGAAPRAKLVQRGNANFVADGQRSKQITKRGLVGETPSPRRTSGGSAAPGWSVYGAGRSQPVAIAGKSGGAENGPNTVKPLPWIATGCRSDRMVGRFSGSGRLAMPYCGWVWSRLWSLQVEEAPSLDAKTASLRWFPIPRSTPMRVMTPYLRGSR